MWDILFSLDEAARATSLQAIMQSFHPTYISLWSYLPHPSNCLLNLDGLFREEDEKQPSSSLGSFERRLFDDYRQLIFNVENNLVPGHAFLNNISFLEVQESLLQTHSSSQIQRQFYAAAGVKSAVFMGSSNGEIELGFSEVNMVEKMKQTSPFPSWEEVSSMAVLQNPPPPTSSSSSLKSPSIESPDSPSFFYNDFSKILLPPLPRLSKLPSSSSSSSCSSSSSLSGGLRESAFKKYATTSLVSMNKDNRRRQSMMQKWIVFYRNLSFIGIPERIQASRPGSAQLLHMIAERRRREKLNESFQALRPILPPGTKKDKASVLATTREYLTKLKAQVAELSHKNQMLLEAQALQNREQDEETKSSSVNERFTVRVTHAPPELTPSNNETEIIDLEITVRGDGSLMAEIAIRVLEFLKNIANVRAVLSFHGLEQIAPSSLSRLGFRFSLQGGEWDESAFLEAVRRIVSDLAPPEMEKQP